MYVKWYKEFPLKLTSWAKPIYQGKKAPLAGHVDSEITQTPILEQTAKHSPINLRFCLFVKIQ